MTDVVVKKILVVGPSWIGDMVMSQSLYRYLKAQDPNVQIDVLAPSWSGPILKRMPEITNLINMPVGHGKLQIKVRYQLAKQLQKQAYDQAIVLPNSLKSALIPFLAKIPKRTGWKGEQRYFLLNDLRPLNKQVYPLMVQRYLALGASRNENITGSYAPALLVDDAERQAAISKYNLNLGSPIIVLCPGAAFGPSKQWPIEYFADLAKAYINKGYSIWLLGGKSDSQVVSEINSLINMQGVDLTATSLSEAVDLLSLADVVVTNDSGLMHIAAALNKPIAAIYGSTSPDFTPPLADKVKIISSNQDCSPCFKRACPFGHYKCMQELSAAKVSIAVEELCK